MECQLVPNYTTKQMSPGKVGFPPARVFVEKRVSYGLRCWDSHAITWNDLCLIREHLAAAGVHKYFQPIHVIRPICLIVAKRFHAGKVFQPTPLRIQERPVQAEIV